MARKHMGRHRAPSYSPFNELAGIAAQSAQPAMKVSAVAVASGGLLATFALPASAAPGSSGTTISTVGDTPALALAPQLASAVSAVAVAAPAKPANAPTFGMTGFSSTAAAPAAAPVMMIAKIQKAVAPAVTTTRYTRSTRSAAPATQTTASAASTVSTAAAPSVAPSGGILGAAAALSGIPYVYGGMSRGGADCSGYTSLVFAAIGRSIPRTAEAQRQAATPVSNPVPGDLIFFGFPAYHVGIFAGNGMMYDNQHPGTTSGLHSIWTMRNVSFGRI